MSSVSPTDATCPPTPGSCSRTRSGRSGRTATRSTASTPSCWPPGSPGGRRRCCARSRNTCVRAAHRSRRTTSKALCAATSTSPGSWCSSSSSVRAELDRRRRGRLRAHRPRAGRRRESRPRPHPAFLPHDHRRDTAHQLLPGGRHQALHLLQAGALGDPRPARAAAEVRDLRLLSACRRCPPPLRRGGPWRAAMVRSPRRLPHRGARTRQGPDGEEHRDRSSRFQGWFLLQAAARHV